MVLDGEITAPDDRGLTHLGHLQKAMELRKAGRLAYFAFDLLHLDGHDLRACLVEERKALLERVLNEAECPRVVYVSHVVGKGDQLFARAYAAGCEGIISKRLGTRYRAGQSRHWVKCKRSETGEFVVTGFRELGPLRLEAIRVAEERSGVLVPAGEVQFGVGNGLWMALDPLRAGGADERGVVPVRSEIRLTVKFFGRHRGGAIRDGVVLRAAE
jgi:bifunctional non-homologous end joining protein LigD